MASSSTSSIHKTSFKYDVFLSFRGEDIRTNFVDHLYHHLKRENIDTYKDDKNLEKGKKICKELIQAIEDSRFHVIIFSKDYASSSWCLDELVKIMECQKSQTHKHTVYPIFYDVEPTQVRKQSGEFGKAFAKHENDEAAEKWRETLVQATSFSGRNLSTTVDGHEAEFIQLIVKDISSKLPALSADENLIGMRTRINCVISSLNAFPDEFCMIGITGMGGIGKTTLARSIFDQICNEFEGSSFVENVRECSNSLLLGLKSLQQQVLRDVLKRQDITVNGVLEGKKEMKKYMCGRKVLVVLDDVDHIDQLKALAGKPNWFKSGSKIIITIRDKQVLVAHKVVKSNIHDVNLLTDEEAICLLSRCAFGTESPIPGYKELSKKVVSYAAGLPLTITILGSSLCDENEHVWIDTLKELEKIPLDGTLEKLELSYMGLDTNCKEIFLDIACILKGWEKNDAIRVLESRGFHAIRGLSVLEKRSLVTISINGRLDMHDHLEEMGKYIVRRSNLNEPGSHSRLWIEEEIKDILVNDLGTEATTCLQMRASKINPEIVMKGLGKMVKLKLLHVHMYDWYSDLKVDKVSQYFPNSLQYLKWYGYPFCSLPRTFQASNLVNLEMPCCNMQRLWEGRERKVLHKLRFFDFSYSKLRTFDLGLTPNLEMLNLQNCQDLIRLDIPAVGCPKLKSLNLGFSKLSTFDIRLVPNIETLKFNQCGLVELDIPCECPQLKSLNLSSLPKLRSINLRLAANIETLTLVECDALVELQMPRECPQLKSLNLSCPNLRSFNLGPTPNIKTLKLEECDYLVELDMFLQCPQLESLDLMISKLRDLDLGPTPNLKTLKLQGCDNLVELHKHDERYKLNILMLRCPQLRTFDLGLTLNLEALTLDGHDDLVELLMSVGCPELKYLRLINSKLRTLELTLNLKTLILESCDLVELHIPDGDVMLESLDIKRCSELKTLELTLNLKTLIIEYCYLVELHIPDGDVKLRSLDIIGCLVLKTLDLGRTPNLESLCLEKCYDSVKLHAPVGGLKKLMHFRAKGFFKFTEFNIVHAHGLVPALDVTAISVHKCPLHPDNDFEKFVFECSYEEDLPSSIGNIEKLISVGSFSCVCEEPQSFFGNICDLQHLTKLSLTGSISEVPKDLDRLQCLEVLSLWCTEIKHLPDNICMLKHLKGLSLYRCRLLEKLPDDLGRLECLEILILSSCQLLRDIPKSICRMKSLKHFSLRSCNRVKEFPEELGCLECLEELDISGTRISNLPRRILSLEGLRIIRSEDETSTTTTTGVCCTMV